MSATIPLESAQGFYDRYPDAALLVLRHERRDVTFEAVELPIGVAVVTRLQRTVWIPGPAWAVIRHARWNGEDGALKESWETVIAPLREPEARRRAAALNERGRPAGLESLS